MKKVRSFFARQGFFLMLALCVLIIAGSGFWAFRAKKGEQSLETNNAPGFVQTLEQAEMLRLYRPVDGEPIAGFSGVSYLATLSCWGAHEAVDFLVEAGGSVYSAQAGTIIDVFRDSQWGGVIVIEHENNMKTKYYGLVWPVAKAISDQVEAGERIGAVGTIPIESAEPSHLHFEMEIDGSAADPMRYII